MTRPTNPPPQYREICYGCFRPTGHCLCNLIDPFEAHCNLLILQHPNEWRKYYSTAKLVVGAVKNSKLLRGINFDQALIEQQLGGTKPYLLYPSETSLDCEEVVLDRNSSVIVVDGTWREARKILYHTPYLKTLPCLSFNRPLLSQYRIRRQPMEHCLSTIESVGYLLKLNAMAHADSANANTYESLFQGFARMIDRQLAFQALQRGRPSKRAA